MKTRISSKKKLLGYFCCGSHEVNSDFFSYIAVREDGKSFTNIFLQDMYEIGEEVEPNENLGWTMMK